MALVDGRDEGIRHEAVVDAPAAAPPAARHQVHGPPGKRGVLLLRGPPRRLELLLGALPVPINAGWELHQLEEHMQLLQDVEVQPGDP